MTHYRDLKQHTHEVSRRTSVPIRPSRRPGQDKQTDPLRSSTRACDPHRSTLEDPCATIASPSRLAAARAVTRRGSGRNASHCPDRSVNSIHRDVQHETRNRRAARQPNHRDHPQHPSEDGSVSRSLWERRTRQRASQVRIRRATATSSTRAHCRRRRREDGCSSHEAAASATVRI